jgi:hypothetical protein
MTINRKELDAAWAEFHQGALKLATTLEAIEPEVSKTKDTEVAANYYAMLGMCIGSVSGFASAADTYQSFISLVEKLDD